MAYTYTPFDYTSTLPMAGRVGGYGDFEPSESPTEHSLRQQADVSAKFRDYAGQQFKGLFDMANINPNPLQGFAQTPTYSPYSGTRGDFTTGGERYDEGAGGESGYRPTVFDQKGYLDARFGNINNYLSGLSSFLGNIGGSGASNAAVRQAEMQRAAHRASMPTIGMSQPMGTPQMGSNPASPGLSGFGGGAGRLVGKGWGSHPAFKGLLAGGGE